jgi:hypothetical protein
MMTYDKRGKEIGLGKKEARRDEEKAEKRNRGIEE